MADTATRLRILASVEGIQGFNQLKASLQGLAQQGQQSGRSLDRLYTATQQLAGAGKNSVSSLRLQVQALTQLRDAAEIGSRRYRILGQDIERVNQQLRSASAAQAGAGAAGGGAGAGLIGGLAARFVAPLATGATVAAVGGAGMEAEAAQTRLKALTDQYGEYNKAQASAATVAQTLRLSTAEAQGEFASLYASLRPVGVTVKEIEDAMIGFGAAARNSGATAQETSNAMIQLKQALASGVLQGEELRSIREQAPLVAQAIAKEMRVPIGALKDLAAEGKVTSDVVLRALGKLRDTQLGKLNAQFATTQQAVTDLGNAFKDTSAELFKLFGPTVISGLKLLTGLLKDVGQNLKTADQVERARIQAARDVQKRFPGIEGATALTPRSRAFFNERVEQILARLKQLEPDQPTTQTRGAQASAEAERLAAEQARAKKAAEEAAKKKSAEDLILRRPFGAQIIAAAKKEGLDPALFAGLISTESGFSQTARSPVGAIGLGQLMPGTAADLGVNPYNASENLLGSARYLARMIGQFGLMGGVRAYNQGPGNQQRFPGGVSQEAITYPGKVLSAAKAFGYEDKGGVSAASLQMNAIEAAQKAAQQRAEEQSDYRQKRAEQLASIQDINAQRKLELALMRAQTEQEQLQVKQAQERFDVMKSLTAEVEKLVDPDMAQPLIRATEKYLKQKHDIETRDLQTKQQAERDSAVWADQQLSLNETLSQYYQQQADKLQEQNVYAESLSQTLGQGMQQAFSLAIQGADDLGAKLQELGATVLKDIAQQLIQISIIAPIVRSIAGIGGGGGITPIAPGISAAGGADFARFFGQAGVSAFAGGGGGLPGVNFTGIGTTGYGFGFASGGIMTPQGPMPLRTYARGGIATAPQAAIYGEGSTPEAFVPLPDGRRIPVALRQYPGIPGAPGAPGGGFEQTDEVVRQMVVQARQESAAATAAAAAGGGDGTMRIQLETTRINSVDYITAEQAAALANAAAARSTARQQRALQASPGARRGIGI